MNFLAKIQVKLKKGYYDPEGEATRASLRDLLYPIENISVSKVYDVILKAKSIEEAKKIATDICIKLLANPVKDDYNIELTERK